MLVEIERKVIDRVPVGLYLVAFEAIYGTRCNQGEHDDCLQHGCIDNGSDYVAEIESVIKRVTKANYRSLQHDVNGRDDTLNAESLNVDDTHDLRPRLFRTKKEASEHARFTVNRFKKPALWECFVKF